MMMTIQKTVLVALLVKVAVNIKNIQHIIQTPKLKKRIKKEIKLEDL